MKWPKGIRAGVAASGIKPGGGLDVGVIVPDRPVAWAGCFTQNAAAAAPVRWSRGLIGRSLEALVANSGNANACTGTAGEFAVRRTVRAVADAFACPHNAIAVASTGPIGVSLPAEKIESGIAVCRDLHATPEDFARSIMTTDTYPKTIDVQCGGATVTGVAKGAAMIAPNMATMLAFIVTDAEVGSQTLQGMTAAAVDQSFNRISIDGCESTNDSVFVLASGVRGPVDERALGRCLDEVCGELARQIVADAEGATRSMRIYVDGAATKVAAVELAKAVAASALWRAALNGADPNWGRVLAAIGGVDRRLNIGDVDLWIGAEQVFARGEPVGSLDAAAKHMTAAVVEISCRVGDGPGRAEVLSADLSSDYVLLNAAGTT